VLLCHGSVSKQSNAWAGLTRLRTTRHLSKRTTHLPLIEHPCIQRIQSAQRLFCLVATWRRSRGPNIEMLDERLGHAAYSEQEQPRDCR